MLQAHDVIAQEIYSEDSIRVEPAANTTFINGEVDCEPADGEGEMDNVTRVRLVQFQKNTEEPMVCTRTVKFYYPKARYTLGTSNTIHVFNTSIMKFNTNIGILWTSICQVLVF